MGRSSYGIDWQQKTYDIVPQSWIIDCRKIIKMSSEVIKFIENSMQGKCLTEVKILEGVLQEGVLSPLHF